MTLGRHFDHVIFDWNGTIVDDVALAVRAVNHVRAEQGMSHLTVEQYRHHFGFPIENFYRRIGFDLSKTPFTDLARSYLAVFNPDVLACKTHAGVDLILAAARRANARTWVLSASHEEILLRDVRQRGLHDAFEAIAGLADNEAAGKEAIAIRLDDRMGTPGPRALLVGDTLHDAEIARARNWSCILVPNGHQSISHLTTARVRLAKSLGEVARYIDSTQEVKEAAHARA